MFINCRRLSGKTGVSDFGPPCVRFAPNGSNLALFIWIKFQLIENWSEQFQDLSHLGQSEPTFAQIFPPCGKVLILCFANTFFWVHFKLYFFLHYSNTLKEERMKLKKRTCIGCKYIGDILLMICDNLWIKLLLFFYFSLRFLCKFEEELWKTQRR